MDFWKGLYNKSTLIFGWMQKLHFETLEIIDRCSSFKIALKCNPEITNLNLRCWLLIIISLPHKIAVAKPFTISTNQCISTSIKWKTICHLAYISSALIIHHNIPFKILVTILKPVPTLSIKQAVVMQVGAHARFTPSQHQQAPKHYRWRRDSAL